MRMKQLQFEDPESIITTIKQEIANVKDGRYVHRMDALLLIALGRNAYEVAEMYGHSPRSLHDWIKGVKEHGIEYLKDEPKPGRPSKLDEATANKLKQELMLPPSELGYNQARWDGKLLSEHLRKKYDIELKVRRCQELFHELGFSYKRPRKMAYGSSVEAKEAFKKNS
jgi:transposase